MFPMMIELDKTIKVLFASHFGEPIGGISVANRTLLASSFSKRIDVHVVETSGGSLSFSKRGKYRIFNWFNALNNIFRFLQALIKVRPDLVHIGSAHSASFTKHSVMVFMAKVLGVPVVMELHCSIYRLFSEKDSLWTRYIVFVLRKVDGIITLSKEWDALTEVIPSIKMINLPNAIDLSHYLKIDRPKSDQNKSVNLLFLGHIGKEKGCWDLLAALENLVHRTSIPFKFFFVGETLLEGEKEMLSFDVRRRNLSDYVEIYEPVYGDQKYSRFSESDIFVLPSYHEGMPMAIIEAMASGLPVVATRVGGINEQVIPGETGLLINTGDIDSLSNYLLSLIENSERRLSMGEAGRQRAAKCFDVEKRAEKLIAFYKHSCNHQKN